jgi:hypothetical protein
MWVVESIWETNSRRGFEIKCIYIYSFLYFLGGIFMNKGVVQVYDPWGNFSKCFMCESILHICFACVWIHLTHAHILVKAHGWGLYQMKSWLKPIVKGLTKWKDIIQFFPFFSRDIWWVPNKYHGILNTKKKKNITTKGVHVHKVNSLIVIFSWYLMSDQ